MSSRSARCPDPLTLRRPLARRSDGYGRGTGKSSSEPLRKCSERLRSVRQLITVPPEPCRSLNGVFRRPIPSAVSRKDTGICRAVHGESGKPRRDRDSRAVASLLPMCRLVAGGSGLMRRLANGCSSLEHPPHPAVQAPYGPGVQQKKRPEQRKSGHIVACRSPGVVVHIRRAYRGGRG
jgi:hypothetical protein